MQVVFMGTPDFSVPSLKALLNSPHRVQAVVTQPDRPRGRGQKVQASPVKQLARQANIPVLQPRRVAEGEFIEKLRKLAPDVIVVVAFGQLIPPEILEIPPYGCINVHASLLPLYRGASPIQQAIIDGCTETGVTTMLLDEGWDTGDILLQVRVPIASTDTAGDLHDKLADRGAKLLLETLEGLEAGTIVPTPQDDSKATYAYKLKKDAGQIRWEAPVSAIVNLVRGVNPWPGAYTTHAGQQLKVWEAVPVQKCEKQMDRLTPGEVVGIDPEAGILVAAGDGYVALRTVQPPNRQRMTGQDYANGYHLRVGDILGGSPGHE